MVKIRVIIQLLQPNMIMVVWILIQTIIPLEKNGININKNWGSITIYQIKENDDITPVSVYFPENYEFRGKELRKLNRVEYYCLTHIKPIFKGNRNINKYQRTKAKQFKFSNIHKLEVTHAKEIRSKQSIPMHTKKIPNIPNFLTK